VEESRGRGLPALAQGPWPPPAAKPPAEPGEEVLEDAGSGHSDCLRTGEALGVARKVDGTLRVPTPHTETS
jgi:hypothetical protein